MNNILMWYNRNYQAITWFLTGWMSFALLVDISHGAWSECLFDLIVIALNIYFVRK
jgi:hypothetical protein